MLTHFTLGSLFFFQLISEEIADLRHNHATTMAKLAQFKRKHLELSHRILEVILSNYSDKCYTDIQKQKCAEIKIVVSRSISSGSASYLPKEKLSFINSGTPPYESPR